MKWWDLGTAALLTIVAGIVWSDTGDGHPLRVTATAALAAFALLYAFWGRRLLRDRPHGDEPATDGVQVTAFVLAAIAVTAVGVYAQPNTLVLQCLIFPFTWVLSATKRRAITLNVVAVVVFTSAYALGLGGGVGLWVEGASIEALSLGFSIMLGLWINNIADAGVEKARLYDELAAAQGELAALSRDAGAAAERERIARDIHDTIAQSLTGIVMLAQRGAREQARDAGGAAERETPPAPDAGTYALIETMGREALDEARALVAALAKLPDADASLDQALRRLAERFSRETHVRVDVESDELPALPRDTEVMLLRCAQEALANVRKHAGATAALVSLTVGDGQIELRIDDDGRGFPSSPDAAGPGSAHAAGSGSADAAGSGSADAAHLGSADTAASAGTSAAAAALDTSIFERGFGLTGMRDRLDLARGTLQLRTLTSPAGAPIGASVTVTAPLAPAPSPANATAPEGSA